MTKKELFLGVWMVIFSSGVMAALSFPIHPGTWSMPVWFYLVYTICKKNYKSTIFACVFLGLFRETFFFAIFGLSLYFLFLKEKRYFLMSFLISLIGISFVFFLRPYFLGPVADYGTHFLKDLFSSPFSYLIDRLLNLNYIVFIGLFGPLILPFYYYFKDKKKLEDAYPFLCVFLMISPLLLLHFMANKFNFHYGYTFSIPLISLLYCSRTLDRIRHAGMIVAILVLFGASSTFYYGKMLLRGVFNYSNQCSMGPQKSESTLNVVSYVNELNKNKVVLATGGIIQRIMKPGLLVYPPRTLVKLPQRFDVVIFEKNDGGDIVPITTQMVDEARERCIKNGVKVIQDDDYYFVAEGMITRENCYKVFYEK